MGALGSASGCRILLHRPLWRRRYNNYDRCKDSCPSKCVVSLTTIDEKANDLKYLPQIAPLPPPSVLPCGRPPPSKYVVAYTAALIVEGTSLVFMLGRVVWLGSGIKRDVPILKALRTQWVPHQIPEKC